MLGELITQLYRVSTAEQAASFTERILKAIESGQYQLERISSQRFAAAWQMRIAYADKPAISFVDFTSMVVMRELGLRDIFTGDREFEQANLGFRLWPNQ